MLDISHGHEKSRNLILTQAIVRQELYIDIFANDNLSVTAWDHFLDMKTVENHWIYYNIETFARYYFLNNKYHLSFTSSPIFSESAANKAHIIYIAKSAHHQIKIRHSTLYV